MNIRSLMQNMFNRCRNADENCIDFENARSILRNEKNAVLLDVRNEHEYKEEHLEGSINIPLYDLEKDCNIIGCSKQNIIIVYCQSGIRSKKAVKILRDEGYENVYEIKGGLDEIS